jgi:hypothetical protein
VALRLRGLVAITQSPSLVWSLKLRRLLIG